MNKNKIKPSDYECDELIEVIKGAVKVHWAGELYDLVRVWDDKKILAITKIIVLPNKKRIRFIVCK